MLEVCREIFYCACSGAPASMILVTLLGYSTLEEAHGCLRNLTLHFIGELKKKSRSKQAAAAVSIAYVRNKTNNEKK
jgi:hypothetical protein